MLFRPKKHSFKMVQKSKFFKNSIILFKNSNILSRVFISQIGPEKIVFRYSRQERMIFRPKGEVLKSPKN